MDPTNPTTIKSVTANPEKSLEYPREHINCSICVAKQLKKPTRLPNAMNNPMYALYLKMFFTLKNE